MSCCWLLTLTAASISASLSPTLSVNSVCSPTVLTVLLIRSIQARDNVSTFETFVYLRDQCESVASNLRAPSHIGVVLRIRVYQTRVRTPYVPGAEIASALLLLNVGVLYAQLRVVYRNPFPMLVMYIHLRGRSEDRVKYRYKKGTLTCHEPMLASMGMHTVILY